MRALDLFAGIGGFHLGMRAAGHHVVGAAELDAHARAVYARHFPGTPLWGDATQVPAAEFPAHDILCGGFPCQPFSVAGRRAGIDDARGTLFYEIARVAEFHRPRWLLLENVPGLLSIDDGHTYEALLRALDAIGYDAGWQVLRGEDWLPQARHRLWIVGTLRGGGGREILPLAGTGAEDTGGGRPEARRIRSGRWGDRLDIVTGGEAKTLMAAGGSASERTGLYTVPFSGMHLNGHGQHLRDDGRSYTLSTWKEDACVATGHPRGPDVGSVRAAIERGEMRVRRLTPLECERVQGFPDNWTAVKGVPEGARYRLCGNAVMPPVVEFLGRMMS